jgi:hypothetical protein
LRFSELESRASDLLIKHGYPGDSFLRANIGRLLSVDKEPSAPSRNVDKWHARASVPLWVDGYVGALELLTAGQFKRQECYKKLVKERATCGARGPHASKSKA